MSFFFFYKKNKFIFVINDVSKSVHRAVEILQSHIGQRMLAID